MSDTELSSLTATTERRGRGRPKKESSNGTTAETFKNGGHNGQTSSPKKRGRKPVENNSSIEPKSGPSNAKRGRGRPKGKGSKSNKNVSKKGGRRGRPKKTESVEEEAAPLDEDLSASHEEEDEDDQ